VECNTITAIKNTANKLLMIQAFQAAGVIIPPIVAHLPVRSIIDQNENLLHIFNESVADAESYPMVAKHLRGSRGTGNYLLKSVEEFDRWSRNRELSNYIFQGFVKYNKEYRLHVTSEGCFYTCRKMLKTETPASERWHRHDSNCVWVLEENPLFDKPANWGAIVTECVKALNAVGLDVGACDVKVQSSTNSNGERRTNPKFVILEINSAPSCSTITTQKYLEEIPKILTRKYNG
jgi:glutathione synthase/RimK-type ligase-like ATP-grasp enzyme